jgi:hypothetical protein
MWDRMVSLFWSLWRSPLTSSSHGLIFIEKNDVAESLGPFDIRKVFETQKHAKTRELVLQC